MLPRYLGQDLDTPTYIDALSGRNLSCLRRSEGQHGYSKAVLSLLLIKWNVDDFQS